VNVPGSVFFPILKQSVLLASILGVCSSIFTGSDWEDITKTTVASAGSAGIATTASLIASRKAFLAPFMGPMTSIVTFIILKKLLDKITEPDDVCFEYQEYENIKPLQTIPDETAFPLFALPEEPIGMLKDGQLLLNEASIQDQAEIWICDSNQN